MYMKATLLFDELLGILKIIWWCYSMNLYECHFRNLYGIWRYSGISIKRTHYKADTSIRRTVWRGTDCCALRSNYLRKNLYKTDSSIKRTFFFLHQWYPLYRDSTVIIFCAPCELILMGIITVRIFVSKKQFWLILEDPILWLE